MKRAKVIYLSIIIVCLSIISFSTYFILGGFDPIEIYFFEGTTRTVTGNEYVIPNRQFASKMDSVKSKLTEFKLKGRLTSVIYQDGSVSEDSIHCFIGVSQDSVKGVQRMPAGFDYKLFQTDKIYKIFITQHPLVRPVPETIEEIMQAKASEEGEVLQPYTFELYYQDGSLSIEKWVK